jgi:AMMECR1 domain-containing protein
MIGKRGIGKRAIAKTWLFPQVPVEQSLTSGKFFKGQMPRPNVDRRTLGTS